MNLMLFLSHKGFNDSFIQPNIVIFLKRKFNETSFFDFPYSSVNEVIDKLRLLNHDPMISINFMQFTSFMFKEVALPFLSPKCKCFLLATDKDDRN